MLAIVTSKSRTFKNAFFLMFVATGIADTTSLLANSFLRANRQLNLSIDYKHIVLFAIVTGGTAYIAHMIGNLLIAINRFSALCLMQRYDEIWSRKNVRIAIALQYLVAFLACIHVIRTDLVYIQNADGTYTFKGLEKQSDQIVRCFYFGFSILYALVSVGVNVRLVFEWYRLSWLQNGSGPKIREKGLLIYTVFVFVSTMLMCTQQVITGMAAFTSNDKLYSWAVVQFFWCNDIMLSIPPFSILLLSSELRNNVFNFLRGRKTQQGVISSIPMFVSRSTTNQRT
nr:7TM GPCR domain containing protein [Haemonchus contortus]